MGNSPYQMHFPHYALSLNMLGFTPPLKDLIWQWPLPCLKIRRVQSQFISRSIFYLGRYQILKVQFLQEDSTLIRYLICLSDHFKKPTSNHVCLHWIQMRWEKEKSCTPSLEMSSWKWNMTSDDKCNQKIKTFTGLGLNSSLCLQSGFLVCTTLSILLRYQTLNSNHEPIQTSLNHDFAFGPCG